MLRERYEPKDLFNEVRKHINLIGGTLSGDDTVIDKPYSDPNLTAISMRNPSHLKRCVPIDSTAVGMCFLGVKETWENYRRVIYAAVFDCLILPVVIKGWS